MVVCRPPPRRLRTLATLIFTVFISGFIYIGCFYSDSGICLSANKRDETVEILEVRRRTMLSAMSDGVFDGALRPITDEFRINPQISFDKVDLEREFVFDVDGDRDVLVFLHIQKTGGTTFGRHLVRDLQSPCVCYEHQRRCDCRNALGRTWLFSRFSTGWACGLHADWTELHECVAETLDEMENKIRTRRYLYVTILREPVQRYISEWKHVQRGSTWISAKLMCNGHPASLDQVPFCFQGADWTGVALEDFLSCRHNLAHNRQTRMLADLRLVGCYNESFMPVSERDDAMLNSAKQNLREMAFFGLTEFQAETQYLFEQTFHMRFVHSDFTQYNMTHAERANITDQQSDRLAQLNHLDGDLYNFAKQLFFSRLHRVRSIALGHQVTSSPKLSEIDRYRS